MALKVWRGSLSPKLEEEYHDMLKEIAKQQSLTQTDALKYLIQEKYEYYDIKEDK